jgi:hypothetical protein
MATPYIGRLPEATKAQAAVARLPELDRRLLLGRQEGRSERRVRVACRFA